jgi:hypothetical protein
MTSGLPSPASARDRYRDKALEIMVHGVQFVEAGSHSRAIAAYPRAAGSA